MSILASFLCTILLCLQMGMAIAINVIHVISCNRQQQQKNAFAEYIQLVIVDTE